MDEKGYVIAVCDDSDYYLPWAEHIERNDSRVPWEFVDDEEAAKGAERDGVKLIYGLRGVEDGVYLDTPQNRALIEKVLESRRPSVVDQLHEKRQESTPTSDQRGVKREDFSR